jgi:hypothetical protein
MISRHGLRNYSFTPPSSNTTRLPQTLDRKLPSTHSTVDRNPNVTIGAAPTTGMSFRYDNQKQHRDQVPAINSASASAIDLSMFQDHELFVVDTSGSRMYEARLRCTWDHDYSISLLTLLAALGEIQETRGTWRSRRSRSASPRRIEEESCKFYLDTE